MPLCGCCYKLVQCPRVVQVPRSNGRLAGLQRGISDGSKEG